MPRFDAQGGDQIPVQLRGLHELCMGAAADHPAVAAARLEEGTGLEAFRRLCAELIDSLDVLIWWMTELGEAQGMEESTEDRMIAAAIARGHQDGTIDRQLSVEWISNVVWSVLYAVHYIPSMVSISAFEARQQALHTMLKAAAADPSSA